VEVIQTLQQDPNHQAQASSDALPIISKISNQEQQQQPFTALCQLPIIQ